MKKLLCLAVSLAMLATACDENWGDPELLGEFQALRADELTSALLKLPNAETVVFPQDLLPKLLGRLDDLVEAKTIGKVSSWIDFCRVELESTEYEPMILIIATRESLDGLPVVVLRDKTTRNPRMGFYDGKALHSWLVEQGLCEDTAR